MSSQADSVKSIWYALIANFSIAIAKFCAALYTGSTAMLAEAIHSTADCGNQGLLLYGLKVAKLPPSPDYPLGYGKAIYFWSFIVALILFSMGGLFSIYEGVHKISGQETLSSPWVAVAVLIFGIIAEAFSLYGCIREVNKVRNGRSLWKWFRESRQSELIVILGEDIAALFGLVFALIAILLTVATGNPIYDALGSIAIGVLLILVAVGVGIEVKDLLIGQSVEASERELIRDFIAGHPEVSNVMSLITLQLGQGIMVAVKAEMHAPESKLMIEHINHIEKRMKERFPAIRWIFFEPDVSD
ncbi:MAG: cation diffusion facilitator family transporter [Pseudomonadota bacterium]